MALEATGKHAEAETLLQKSLDIRRRTLPADRHDIATNLSNLAAVCIVQNRLLQAEPLMKQALAMHEKILGPDHPDTAIDLSNLGIIYLQQGNFTAAEPLLKRALNTWQTKFGPDNAELPKYLPPYADLLRKTNCKADEAALIVQEKAIQAKHPPAN
jgi:tetratricopeptide (TPR) repeat protein